jgi:hypothetical protein
MGLISCFAERPVSFPPLACPLVRRSTALEVLPDLGKIFAIAEAPFSRR